MGLFFLALIKRWRYHLSAANMANPFFKPARWVRQISWPILFFAVLSVLLFVAPWTWLPKPFVLQMEVRTSRATQMRLYYDSFRGIREDESIERMVDSRGVFKTIELPIDSDAIQALRLRINPGVTMTVRNVRLKPLGRAPISLNLEKIIPLSGWCELHRVDSTLTIYSPPDTLVLDLGLTDAPYSTQDPALAVALLSLIASAALLHNLLRRSKLSMPGAWRCYGRRASDKHAHIIVALFTGLFLILVLGKFNGSSSALWRFYADGRTPDHSLLLGIPKDIRSDEWMVQTPWILSQASNTPPFGLHNPNVGDMATLLVVNLPVRHWTTLFRPQFWGFFLVDIEHAFSLYWNFKWYVFIVGGFLFFRTIARGNVTLALAAVILAFFSPYVQWWYSTGTCMPEMIGMVFLGLWCLRSVVRGKTITTIVAAMVGVLFATENFIFCCYPRFQVPLFYLAFIVVAWMLRPKMWAPNLRVLRCACLLALFALVALLGLIWYGEVGPTLRMTAQLEYPGKVFSVGGGVHWFQFFVPLLEFGMTEYHFPQGLVNACVASGFVLLLPFIGVIFVTTRRRRWDGLLIALLALLGFIVYFMMVGIPAWAARYSGWSFVYDTRGILPFGLISIACLVRVLAISKPRLSLDSAGFHWLLFGVFALAWGATLWFVNGNYNGFTSGIVVGLTAVYFALVTVLFSTKSALIGLALLVIPTVISNGFVNPLEQGLAGFYRNSTFVQLNQYVRKDPSARWLVMGRPDKGWKMAHLAKAAGANVLSGIRNNPNAELFRILDPESKYFDIWNRFAVISYDRSPDERIKIVLTSGVSYTIFIPFTASMFDRLGVRYIVQVDPAEDEPQIPGFSLLGEQNGLRLLTRNAGE
jgi:hypothetical protein